MNVSELKRSKFLKQTDVEKDTLVTIDSIEEYNIAIEGAEQEMRWGIKFKEFEKPLILNSTNGQIIGAITGSQESDDWIGWKIVLYTDPNVMYKGERKGGLRVRAAKGNIAQPAKVTESEQTNTNEDIPF